MISLPESLLAIGKEVGYVTHGQVNESIADDEFSADAAMELILFLQGLGIDLIDESEVEKREAEKWQIESSKRSFLHFLHSTRHQIDLIRKCKAIPANGRLLKNSNLRWECGHVYLMEKMVLTGDRPNRKYVRVPNPIHKIGKTDRKWKVRSSELWNQHRLIGCHSYPTVVAFPLEQALHRHYDEYRVRRQGERQKGQRKNLEGERFKLPAEEVDEFLQTVAAVEAWVLASEEARLELDLLRVPIIGKKLSVKPEELLP